MGPRSNLAPVDAALVRVTDHAVLRWLERVEGYPVEDVRRALITPTLLLGMAMGARRLHCPDAGVSLQIVGTTVVTVLPYARGEAPSPEPRPQRQPA